MSGLVRRADSCIKPQGANRTPSAPLSAAAPPHPQRGFQRGGPQPAPLCRFKGVRGEIEIPPRFSLGGRGGILFSKENIPLASPYRTGTVPPGTPVIFSARRKENGDSIRCRIAAHPRTSLVRLMSQKENGGDSDGQSPSFVHLCGSRKSDPYRSG